MTSVIKLFSRTLVVALLVASLSGCSPKVPADPPAPKPLEMAMLLSDVGKLRLAEMTLSKVGTVSDPSFGQARSLSEKARAVVDRMKVGSRIGIYSYHTYVSAYIDLSELSPEDIVVDSVTRVATFLLPPVRIEWSGRDMEFREEHYRVTGLRSPIDPRERAELKDRMARSLQQEVAADPEVARVLSSSARARATAFVAEMCVARGLSARVDFREK